MCTSVFWAGPVCAFLHSPKTLHCDDVTKIKVTFLGSGKVLQT